ncbi:hypothetical protein ACFSC4_10510 [Deinococcus malanensis]|uniref:hypothetical protein n=1 Tax=Deinococcus malanensis TaxID=1706855 RepID=UPI0036417A6E
MNRISIVIYNITPPGGVERAAVNLANSLADTFEVNIVSLYSKQGQPFYPLDGRVTITHLGVPFTPACATTPARTPVASKPCALV